ncbi:ATP-dependent DNA helicase PIF1-like protein [Tanacetum coccineum]
MVLTDISLILQYMGKSLSDFDLPNITTDVRSYSFGCREVHEEYSIVVQEEVILTRNSLNTDKKNTYDTIMKHIDDNSPGVFFIDGPRGTGKTFLYKALLATVRSRGLITLATASSRATTASKDALINEIFLSFATNAHSSANIVSRAILSTKNEHVDGINDMLIDCFLAKRRNLDPKNGLCNGMRLICKRFDPNVINAEIAVGQHSRVRVLLPRIHLAPSEEDMFPFKLKRT